MASPIKAARLRNTISIFSALVEVPEAYVQHGGRLQISVSLPVRPPFKDQNMFFTLVVLTLVVKSYMLLASAGDL